MSQINLMQHDSDRLNETAVMQKQERKYIIIVVIAVVLLIGVGVALAVLLTSSKSE